MNTLQLLTAVRRIPLVVLGHQLRRKLRDAVAPRLPGAYRQWMKRAGNRFPEISRNRRLPAQLADFIAHYYRSSPDACRDAAQGAFHLMGTTVDFGSIEAIDWRHRLARENDHHLWRMKLCQLEILHSLLAEGRREDGATALALLKSFERAAGFGLDAPFRTVWSPYGASHRILAILSGLALAQSRGTLEVELERTIHRFLHRDAAFVRANVEHDLCNNHTERNLAALCLYGMVCESFDKHQTARLDKEVRAIIERTILPDGMQIERSAMYQGLSVMALRIFAAADFLSPATRSLAETLGGKAERAWQLMSHRDGDIALFNDSWIGETPRARDVLERPEPLRAESILPCAGYLRLESDEIDVWMDVGDIGPEWNPGHGHADFLGIEVDIAGERLIVDPGTSQYSTGPRRAWERSAAAHNGPCHADFEPVEYFGCFKVGRLAAAQPVEFAPSERAIGGRLATSHATVRRSVSAPSTGTILIADSWTGPAEECRSRFLVPADWQLRVEEGQVHFQKGMTKARLDVLHGRIELAGQDMWCRHYMAPEPAHVLTLRPRQGDTWHTATIRLFHISRSPKPKAGEQPALVSTPESVR